MQDNLFYYIFLGKYTVALLSILLLFDLLILKFILFTGEEGKYICAGSDDGIVFIWDRVTTEIVHAFWGDVSIVNCVQPHPSVCFIASSGIDSAVKLWSPLKEVSLHCCTSL